MPKVHQRDGFAVSPSEARSMTLKSTYKRAPPTSPASEEALPPGWTEHEAPSGHSYYYHAETKQSTYTRPVSTAATALNIDYNAATAPLFSSAVAAPAKWQAPQVALSAHEDRTGGSFHGGRSYQDRSRRQNPEDRPKSKIAIPNCEPWVLVKTKLGRRFVYNPEKDESFWKFPQNVLLAVMAMDRRDRENRETWEKESAVDLQPEAKSTPPATIGTGSEGENGYLPAFQDDDSDSYEEVEVTDEDEGDPDAPPKKQKLGDDRPPGPVEFNEDDIEYQLAQMGGDYGVDRGEDSEDYNGEYEGDAEGLPLTEEDCTALFRDLLDDFRVNPYTTWEKIIDEGRIIDDDRYTVLSNMGMRRQAFSDWSRDRIRELQEKRRTEERKDPRIAYLRFLHEHATPKLYWLEFKRKFKREPEMKDSKVADKDREKMYRDHISRLKLPESTRTKDLEELLKEMPLSTLNRDSTLDTLPSALLTNLKYISIPAKARDAVVEKHILSLPAASEVPNEGLSPGEQAELDKKIDDRRKRETALAERERQVQEAKRKQDAVLRHERELQHEEAAQLERARRVGKEGLLGYLEGETQEHPTEG